jgi:hypothetical protein
LIDHGIDGSGRARAASVGAGACRWTVGLVRFSRQIWLQVLTGTVSPKEQPAIDSECLEDAVRAERVATVALAGQEAFDLELTPEEEAALLADLGDDDPFVFDSSFPIGKPSAGMGEVESKEDDSSQPLVVPPMPRLQEATIARLREELERVHVPDYERDLQTAARPEEVVLGLLSPEEAAEREAALENARLRQAAREAEQFARREAALALRQARARADVVVERDAAVRSVRLKEHQAVESRAAVEAAIRKAYREARVALAEELRRQKAVVMERFGVLESQPLGARERAAVARHKLRVEWSHVPQPLKISVHQVRGVKDRLPRGRYVLLVTLWDRLGGRPLRWSRLGTGGGAGPLQGLARPAATRPIRHRGRFYDTELDFAGQSVHTLSPATADLAPAHTLVFELFLLGGRRSPVDRVVAWSALPCCDSDLRPVEGRFRLPMLRGEVDLDMDQFVKMEQRWGLELDGWLGNLYLEVSRVPREQIGEDGEIVGEYDVEITYTSEVLRLRHARLAEDDDKDDAEGGRAGEEAPLLLGDASSPGGGLARSGATRLEVDDDAAWDMKGSDDEDGAAETRKRKVHREESEHLLSAAWESDEDGEDTFQGGVSAASVRPVGAGAGRVTQSVEGVAALSRTQNYAARWKGTPLASISTYSFAVSKQETRGIGRGRRLGEVARKGVYLRQELFGDLLPRTRGGSGLCSVMFVSQLLALIIALYVRAHFHYIGQWLLLQGQRIPVYEFSLNPIALSLKYVGAVIPMEYELGVVIIGPLFVLAVFACLCVVCWFLLICLRHIPELLSRFVAFFGVAAAIDPFIILIVDLATTNFGCQDPSLHPACVADFTSKACRCFEGDAFKLYYRFLRTEGSGVVGIVLTVFVYLVHLLLASFFVYGFLLNLHLDGRMLDLYRRIHGPEDAFSLPHDLELSVRELRWIVTKARRWRGSHGMTRRVAICEYVLTDPLDPAFKETTKHLIIYNSSLDGSRELYRHFLLQPDGTLLEVFGDMESVLGAAASGPGGQPSALQQVLMTQSTTDQRAVESFFQGL